MYCPTVEYIRPRGHPFKTIGLILLSHPHRLSTFPILENLLVTHHIKYSYQDVGCYALLSGPNLQILSIVPRAIGTNHFATVVDTVLLLKTP